jgi:hypothetical protein
MLPISEQYLHSPCEVRSMENSLFLMGHISSFTRDGIQIESIDRMPIIHCNTTVKISVMNSKLGFQTLVGKVYLSTDSMLRVVDLQNAVDYEKRNFFRVKVDTVAEAVPILPVTESEKETKPIRKPVRIVVRDISLSGIFFVSGLELSIGDQLIVNLDIYGTVVSLLCKVVRKSSVELGTKNGYGCEYLDNSGKQFDLLCKYLFDCQREQIQMMKQYAEEARRAGNRK